jgi:hypothetical protein
VEVGALKLTLRRDNRGFVFSLDASLALFVVLMVVVGVARVGGSGLAYEQQGYLRLERHANDALETMILTGSLDNLVDLMAKGDNTAARALARAELGKALPSEVQFKLVVGDNFEVYPSDNVGWSTTFASAPELAVAARVTPRFTRATTARILAWLGGPDDKKDQLDDDFMGAVENFAGRTSADWHVTRVYREVDFRSELLKGQYYDVVFMPDVEVNFNDTTTWRLILYSFGGGKVVVGGKTLRYNYSGAWDWLLWWLLGVEWTGRPPPELVGAPEYDKMEIIDDTRYVTLPYDNGDRIRYSGVSYEQYVYTRISGIWDLRKIHVLAEWDNKPAGVPVTPFPWPGIIIRDARWTRGGWTFLGPSVLFNMRLAQNAMDPSLDPTLKDTNNWVQLAARAIGYLGTSELKPVVLYVWRGEGVD